LRHRRRGRAAPLALAIVILTIPPARMGSEDLRGTAALPVSGGSFRAHFLASPFGTIHAATFRFSLPVGTQTPASSALPLAMDVATAAPALPFLGEEGVEIDRSGKGPRLVPRVRPSPDGAPSANRDGAASQGPDDRAPADGEAAADAGKAPDDGVRLDPGPAARETAEPAAAGQRWPVDGDVATVRVAGIYFTTTSLGGPPAPVSPWPREAPVIGLREFPGEPDTTTAALEATPPSEPADNQTIAPKGEVTGEDRRPKSPAELLDLTGAARAKHEKCLADAIYFEARGEPVRGQMAVAQVVINRVFSGYYPGNVCGVVYQSTRRHRHLRCQFSFTCDGIPDRVTEPDAWDRAKQIARDALDGNFWLNDVGKATHYHARWVYPRWVREMRRLDRIGVHTFYRPRKWGDGAGSPVWGDASAKVEKL
jgi:spore germination cell wall hydrolase CwlJ-like protein